MSRRTAEDIMHVDLSIVAGSNVSSTPAALSQTFTGDLIRNPSDWYVSIVRLAVGMGAVPLGVCPIRTDATNTLNDQNMSIYSVTLSYGGFSATSNIEWRPQYSNQPVPAYTAGKQDLSTYYYFFRTYSWMVKLINEAIDDAYTTLQGLLSVNPFAGLPAPFLQWLPEQSKFAFYMEQSSVTAGLSLGVNRALSLLLRHFPLESYFNTPVEGAYAIYDFSAAPPGSTVQINSETFVQLMQEFPDTQAWNFARRIVCSTSMPIKPDLYPTPASFGTNVSGAQATSSSTSRILTDFDLSNEIGYESNTSVEYYNPSAEFRLIPLQGNSGFSTVDIALYISDNSGTLYPLNLFPGQSANVKLMFRRRGFDA